MSDRRTIPNLDVIPAKAGTSVVLSPLVHPQYHGKMDAGRYCTYILASRKYGALYIGVTGNLVGRVAIHREDLLPGHTSRYHIHHLVYFEQYDDPSNAILREKRLKKWRREWKIELIESLNPEWRDLFDEIVG